MTTTVFHVSDVHFGHPAVPELYESIEATIQDRKFDVVAISGDLTQRARSGEFQRARVFIRINTAHGIARWTLTWNLRQLSVIGTVRREQLERLRTEFAKSPPGDARV